MNQSFPETFSIFNHFSKWSVILSIFDHFSKWCIFSIKHILRHVVEIFPFCRSFPEMICEISIMIEIPISIKMTAMFGPESKDSSFSFWNLSINPLVDSKNIYRKTSYRPRSLIYILIWMIISWDFMHRKILSLRFNIVTKVKYFKKKFQIVVQVHERNIKVGLSECCTSGPLALIYQASLVRWLFDSCHSFLMCKILQLKLE